jgi:Immunity protein 53
MNELLDWLQDWYLSNCNEDWEHTYGIKIDTLDNPGWSVFIDLDETPMENVVFQSLSLERTENDWIFCKTEDKHFQAACGPKNLLEALKVFQDWVISNSQL